MPSDDDLPPDDVYVPLAFFRARRRRWRKAQAPSRVKSSALRPNPAAALEPRDIAELTAVADIIRGLAESALRSLPDFQAKDRLRGILLELRLDRLRRGDVDVPVESGPPPTEGNPVACDVCRKPVLAGDEILSPWGDWIHIGFCYARALMCREFGDGFKPPGYILVPPP
jgi:hypothetical protein